MKAVFLDIDGVIRPKSLPEGFYDYDQKTRKLILDLSNKYGVDYTKYPRDDVLSAYYEWDESPIRRLKTFLIDTGALIISSTDWRREEQPNKMHDLLLLRGLAEFWYADNVIINSIPQGPERRALEINDSLKRYPIENFVVFDDMEKMKTYFPNNAVITNDHLTSSDIAEAMKILKSNN